MCRVDPVVQSHTFLRANSTALLIIYLCMHSQHERTIAGTTGGSAQCVTLTPTVCWKFLRARYVNIPTSITDIKLICRFGVIREEVAIICVRNFLLTEGKVYKFMFIPVLFCLVLMFLLKHFHRIIVHTYTSESICVM